MIELKSIEHDCVRIFKFQSYKKWELAGEILGGEEGICPPVCATAQN